MKGIAGVAAVVVLIAGVTVLTDRITAASSAQPLPVSYGFGGASGWQHAKIKPHSIYFGAGGSLLVRGEKWISWTQVGAIGQGVRWADNCTPSCAAGHYDKTRTLLTLSRVRSHKGVHYFTRLTMLWTENGTRKKLNFRWQRSTVPGVQPFWAQLPPKKHRFGAPLTTS
jgi:hypothetical protein